MFQGRKELLKSVITEDGFSGLINLAVRFAEERIKPEKIHFFASSAQIELTAACNLNCIMCLRSYSKQKTRLMDFNEFRDFLTGAPFLKVISFTGFGEIFLNPDWFKILSYSKQKGIYVWFNDNFTLMDKEKAAKIIDLNIDSIAVSFDAATKKTYEKIRIGADFDKVTRNIKHFVELTNDSGKNKPELFMVFTVMKENFNEMEPFVELTKKLGIKKIFFEKILVFDETKEKSLSNLPKKELEKVFIETSKKAEELGITILGLPDLNPEPEMSCIFPWFSSYISCEGDVLPCCFAEQWKNFDLKEISLGNIKEKSFKEIWKGKKYQLLRKKFNSKDFPFFCRDCHKIKEK